MKNRIDTKQERNRIGQAVRTRRQELRVTLTQMVADTGISIGTLSQMESGKNFTGHTLIRACAYLDLKISLLTDVQ